MISIHDPTFLYETITINVNFQCAWHRDTGNRGDSTIIGLGDYSGGQLFVWPVGDDSGQEGNTASAVAHGAEATPSCS